MAAAARSLKAAGALNVYVTATVYAHALSSDESAAAEKWEAGMNAANSDGTAARHATRDAVSRGNRVREVISSTAYGSHASVGMDILSFTVSPASILTSDFQKAFVVLSRPDATTKYTPGANTWS